MDAQFKAELVKALRSGRYPQCRGGLKSRSGFCCLGVALDIQGAQWAGFGKAVLGGEEIGSLETPKPEFLGGIPTEIADHLIALNDGTDGQIKHSFPEIADYIEANL